MGALGRSITLVYLVGFTLFGAATGAPLTVPYALMVTAGLLGLDGDRVCCTTR